MPALSARERGLLVDLLLEMLNTQRSEQAHIEARAGSGAKRYILVDERGNIQLASLITERMMNKLELRAF